MIKKYAKLDISIALISIIAFQRLMWNNASGDERE